MDSEAELYFVAEINNQIIGCGGINFENDKQIGKISWDIIHPKHQGLGIGKKLLQHRINILKTKESTNTITVRTSQFAYLFYKKNGFTLNNIQKDYWAKGFDLYYMIYEENKKLII